MQVRRASTCLSYATNQLTASPRFGQSAADSPSPFASERISDKVNRTAIKTKSQGTYYNARQQDMLLCFIIRAEIRRKTRRVIVGCQEQKRIHLPGGAEERQGEGQGEKEAGREKVDLPVAQLLVAHSLYYLLRLESPVSQGRIVEEAKYVTGDRQVSDRARGSLRASMWGQMV